jgi:hypothetical protein
MHTIMIQIIVLFIQEPHETDQTHKSFNVEWNPLKQNLDVKLGTFAKDEIRDKMGSQLLIWFT